MPLPERFRLEHRQVVTTSSGKRFVVRASPRALAGDPEWWPLPWPLVLVWVVLCQVTFVVRREPGWRVDVAPAGQQDSGRLVVRATRAEAFRRADAEASALAQGSGA